MPSVTGASFSTQQTHVNSFSQSTETVKKIQRVTGGIFFCSPLDIGKAIVNSKFVQMGAMVGVTMAVLLALACNPIGWVASTIGISFAVAKFLFVAVGFIAAFGMNVVVQEKFTAKITCELSAIVRLFKSDNYHNIITTKDGKTLSLGAIPNALVDAEMLQKELGENGTVISVNESWERLPGGVLVPITKEGYGKLGIDYVKEDALDHITIGPEQLNRLADQINGAMSKGNTYVHCKAGVGRSATAVAAYLIKYQGMTIEEACSLLYKKRPQVTVFTRISGLVAFCDLLTKTQPAVSIATVSKKAREIAEKQTRKEHIPKADRAAFVSHPRPSFLKRIANSFVDKLSSPSMFDLIETLNAR